VIENEGEIFGGAGIKQLDNYEGSVCELLKNVVFCLKQEALVWEVI